MNFMMSLQVYDINVVFLKGRKGSKLNCDSEQWTCLIIFGSTDRLSPQSQSKIWLKSILKLEETKTIH